MIDLNQYQWKNRLLLIFAPSGDDPEYCEQQRMLEGHEAGLAERDVLVMHFVDAPAGPLRDRFGIRAAQFALVLVGKDGGAKLIEQKPVKISRLNELIDSMPMRREEIERGGLRK